MELLALGGRAAGHAAKTLAATAAAINNPDDGAAVAAVGELTAGPSLKLMVKRMMADKDGRYILREQPRVTDATLEYANSLPEGTLGKVYANYMNANGFLPSGRTEVCHIDNPYEAYAIQRHRECHDFLHVATKCDRLVLGELALKGWEFAQTGVPVGAFALVGGVRHLPANQRRLLFEVYVPWAMRSRPGGPLNAKFFMNMRWEELLDKPIEEVRKEARWETLPEVKLE